MLRTHATRGHVETYMGIYSPVPRGKHLRAVRHVELSQARETWHMVAHGVRPPHHPKGAPEAEPSQRRDPRHEPARRNFENADERGGDADSAKACHGKVAQGGRGVQNAPDPAKASTWKFWKREGKGLNTLSDAVVWQRFAHACGCLETGTAASRAARGRASEERPRSQAVDQKSTQASFSSRRQTQSVASVPGESPEGLCVARRSASPAKRLTGMKKAHRGCQTTCVVATPFLTLAAKWVATKNARA